MFRGKKNFFAVLLLFTVTPLVSFAQTPNTEFWMCFPQNFRSLETDPLFLRMIICGEEDATVSVSNNKDFTKQFSLKAKQQLFIEIPARYAIDISEKEVHGKTFHILSDKPITVYQANHRYQTTDIYKAFPVEEFGNSYLIASYRKTYEDLLSQFQIIAINDGTEIEIIPSSVVEGKESKEQFQVKLNKGEIYNIAARYDPLSDSDLSGTIVNSNQPIAVISGHTCAKIPDGNDACNVLIEQITPINKLGKEFYLSPLANRKNYFVRIISSEDETNITIKCDTLVESVKLNRGQVFEGKYSLHNIQILSDKSVLVAQYSTGFKSDMIGDPFMMLIQPVSAYTNRYVISTPFTNNWNNYITIVSDRENIFSLKIDGNVIDESVFQPCGSHVMYKACFQIPSGFHVIEADLPFGMNLFGFGFGIEQYDAYGSL